MAVKIDKPRRLSLWFNLQPNCAQEKQIIPAPVTLNFCSPAPTPDSSSVVLLAEKLNC